MIYLILFIICLLLCWALTHAVLRYLRQKAVLDKPNDRSLHQIPTPRGGGLAVTGVLLVMMTAGSLWHGVLHQNLFLILPFAALMLLSWLDDRKSLSARLRLGNHFCVVIIASLSFPNDLTLFGDTLPLWLDRGLMILGWIWFLNLYNFMDGIDGITGSETIAICCGIIALLLLAPVTGLSAPDTRLGIYAAMMAGCAAGFLLLNWHPAKIFLGDVGSVPLGFMVGYLLLSLGLAGYWASALILPLYYLADSGITITRRLLWGEKIWQAHRQHFYQQATLQIRRHDRVVAWIIGGNILLILCALSALVAPWSSLAAAFLVTGALLLQLHRMARS